MPTSWLQPEVLQSCDYSHLEIDIVLVWVSLLFKQLWVGILVVFELIVASAEDYTTVNTPSL